MARITGMTADKINAIVAIVPISKQILSVAAASITFSSIPSNFNHLKLKVTHPGFPAADYALIQINGDTTVGRYFYGSPTVAAVSDTPGFSPTMKTGNTIPVGFDIEINSTSSTALQKLMVSKMAAIGAVTQKSAGGGYNQAVAVSSLTVVTAGGQLFPIGSEFYLYGVI